MVSLHVRIDPTVKKKVKKILDDLGLDMSTAVNMFFHKIALTESIPFDVSKKKMTHAERVAQWNKEIEEALASGEIYDSAEELFASILAEDDDA